MALVKLPCCPSFVEQLDEADAALDQSPRQQAVRAKPGLATSLMPYISNTCAALPRGPSTPGRSSASDTPSRRRECGRDFRIAASSRAKWFSFRAIERPRWAASSTPFGFERYKTGSPVLRNVRRRRRSARTAAVVARPALVPFALSAHDVAGQVVVLAAERRPSAPKLGRPNCCEPCSS